MLGGRDAVQNENLIKRYFRQHDIYVHADVHGASSVIVKARHFQPCEKTIMGGKCTTLRLFVLKTGSDNSCLSQTWRTTGFSTFVFRC